MYSSDDALGAGNSPATKLHKTITRQNLQHTLTSTSPTKNDPGISRSMGSSVSELPTFRSEHPASVTESQTSTQSMQTSVVTPSTNRTAMTTATRTSQTLDIQTSEKIPEPVASELDKWFRKHRDDVPSGAVTRAYVQNNNPIWVPSSGRRPVFEDSTCQKLQAQLYSLKKAGWIRNGRSVVLVVWNDAQSPVIIRGILGGPGSKSKKQPTPGRSPCRIWKGRAPVTDPAGFLQDSFVFLVRQEELPARAENTLEEAPSSGPNTYTASSSLHSVPPSPALLSRDQARKSKPDDLTVVRQDPREALRNLPPGLRVMLGDYYDKNGTHYAPVCACYEKALSFAIDVDSSIVLQDSFGSKVPVDRFPTGFEGYVFLVAKGERIVRYSHPDAASRNYVAWCGDKLFEPIDLFDYPNNGASASELAKGLDPGRKELSSQHSHTDATDQASREPLLIQNIMHKDESLPPAIKTSPRESIDLTNLLEHESPAHQSKRQKLNPAVEFNDTVVSKSQMPAIPKTTLFGSNQLLPKVATAGATPFMRPNDDGSRAREPHQVPSYTSVHKSSTLTNEYVEVQFVSPNGSVARTKPLKACDSLARLLSHGKLAFGRLSTSGMILIIRIPGIENSITIVDGDTNEFNDFMQLLSDVARGYLDPENRETLRIEVSEMSNEP